MDASKYIHIIENINKELMTCELSGNIGLHAGTSGIALFLAYYDRIILKKNELSPRVMDILEHNIMQIDSGYRLHTICSGISGFGWFCEHLRKIGMFKREDIEFLDDLDPYLYRQMMLNIRDGYYDYLHGALGVGFYFLSRFNEKEVPGYLDELLFELEKSAIACENGAVKWESVLNETGEKGYNISLSHGMSSIVAFLLRLNQMNFETERVRKLLNQTVTYILDQVTYSEKSISYFPRYSKESSSDNYFSRLAWCYGDLGIANCLWRTAIALNNKEWKNMALKIFHHSCKRRDLYQNVIVDAGLCHGSAGVTQIFFNTYQNTHIQEFRDTVDYWIDITIQMAKYADGLAGYKTLHKPEHGGFVKESNLLEGISGIGLVFLSCINRNELTWDDCLLLS